MSEQATTPFSNQCDILGELWLSYRDFDSLEDFMSYNDVGLPLAYFISAEIVKPTPLAETFVSETWRVFLEAIGVEDTGYDNIDELMDFILDTDN